MKSQPHTSESASMQQVPPLHSKIKLLKGDSVLWVIVGFLLVISLLVVYSSTAKMGYSPRMNGTTSGYLTKHIIVLILSIIAMFGSYIINCQRYRQLTWLAYGVTLILTGMVYVMGAETNSAERWLDLGFMSIQPSELLKISTIMVLAQQLAARQRTIHTLEILPLVNPLRIRDKREWQRWWERVKSGTVPILLPVLISCGMVIKSHFSSTIIIFLMGVVMMMIGRVRFREIAKLIAVGVAAVALMLMVFTSMGRGETAVNRITGWYRTITTDTADKRRDFTDSERSVVAIHDGGLLGLGAGRSIMRPRITHPESDYIFAIFVEEYGIIMALFLVLLYLWIIFRAMRIFERSEWIYAGMLAMGLASLITGQALLHILVTLNFAPETGQNLPFITQSGTAMIAMAISMGMILGISRQVEEGSLLPPNDKMGELKEM